MKIARVILELDNSKGELYKGNPWQNHRHAITETFRSNPRNYKARVKAVLEVASANKCQAVVFPACTFISSSEAELADYWRSARIVPWVAAGALVWASGGRHQETACLLHSGRPVLQFNQSSPVQTQLDRAWTFLAISSTVGKIRGMAATPHAAAKEALVLDLGHHQYSGRYMMTLRSVRVDMGRRFSVRPTVLLSFWRFSKGKVTADWAVGHSRLRYRRVEVVKDGNRDYVDIFAI